ncbi:MAG: nucleotidyltransferase family protein [Armatimonadota bacterium]|nr:nucleotidyltransferase family protein [Armatimonadota bacterium]
MIKVNMDREAIAEFCRKNGIRKLSLFGSVLTDDFGPDSDVDVLVEFEPDFHVGLIGLAGLEIDLSNIIGRKVDMRTPKDLSRYFRDKVISSAEVRYAA